MDTKLVEALNNPTRKAIIKVLLKASNGLTVKEVREELIRTRYPKIYRETVYRALETLSDTNIVDKFYVDGKGLCYRLNQTKVEIDLTKLED